MKRIDPWNILWQDAREALIACDFTPITCAPGAEHWVRDDKRVILYPDCEDAPNTATDSVNLAKTAFVSFVEIADELVPIFC